MPLIEMPEFLDHPRVPKYTIILPVFGQEELVEKCRHSIFTHGDGADYKVFTLDDKLYEVGFSNAINIGLSISKAPFIVFMNSDTVVQTNGWLEKLASMFTPHTAAVGPATNNARQWQGQPHPGGDVQPCLINHSFGFDVKLTFFCIMISRAAFLDVGYLDPNLPHGLGADDDWLWRAHRKGWGLKFQPEVMVDHIGQASWDMELRNRQQKEAIEYLKRKDY